MGVRKHSQGLRALRRRRVVFPLKERGLSFEPPSAAAAAPPALALALACATATTDTTAASSSYSFSAASPCSKGSR